MLGHKGRLYVWSDVLAAPICHEHAQEWQVYLPEGAMWTNAATGEECRGGQWVDVPAPLDTMPVFLRDGKPDLLKGML